MLADFVLIPLKACSQDDKIKTDIIKAYIELTIFGSKRLTVLSFILLFESSLATGLFRRSLLLRLFV